MSSTKRKGKSRAAMATETEALLPSSSHSPDSPPRTPSQARLPRQTTSYLFTAGLVIFSAIFSGTLFLLLLGYSFKPSEAELAILPTTAFAYSGPESIHVLDIADHGILVNVTVRLGIDADLALGTKRPKGDGEDVVGQRGLGVGWWERIRRWTARQALAQLPQQAVNVVFPESIDIFPAHFSSPPLLSLSVNQTLAVPLILDVDAKKNWLQPVSFVALARPIASGHQLWEYAEAAWMEGQVKVVVSVPTVEVGLPEGVWWSKYGQLEKQDLTLALNLDVPPLPGLPAPGHELNVSELVHLDSYNLQTTSSHALSINASATLPNPFSHLNLGARIPFSIPFLISLDDGSPMAKVTTSPFTLDNSRLLHLSMAGDIIANVTAQSSDERPSSLSLFLQRFLHGQDNPIIVTGLNMVPHGPAPPPWLLSLLPTVSIPLSFPGPQPPPKVIKTVSIEHMRISERAGQIYASGTVIALVELPETMQKVQLDVKGVSPDVLIYDGPAGDDPADPDDPPARAFGRINPDDFLNSTTAPSDDPLHPYAIIVSAPMVNVPLQILEGRDGVFRSFASKVVFKGGAEAGIKGTASVKVDLKGVKGRAKLSDLPVTGETWVGRQRSSWLVNLLEDS